MLLAALDVALITHVVRLAIVSLYARHAVLVALAADPHLTDRGHLRPRASANPGDLRKVELAVRDKVGWHIEEDVLREAFPVT